MSDAEWSEVSCFACGAGDREECLIECDGGCGRWWHIDCVEPKMAEVPRALWACPLCSAPSPKAADGKTATAKVGDLVFAKYEGGYPWWPARVLEKDARVSAAVPRRGQLTRRSVECEFVDRNVRGKVDALRVVPFANGLASLRRWENARVGADKLSATAFYKALGEAADLAAERKAAIDQISLDDARKAILPVDFDAELKRATTSTFRTTTAATTTAATTTTPPRRRGDDHSPQADDDEREVLGWVRAMIDADINDEKCRLVLIRRLRCSGDRAAGLVTYCHAQRREEILGTKKHKSGMTTTPPTKRRPSPTTTTKSPLPPRQQQGSSSSSSADNRMTPAAAAAKEQPFYARPRPAASSANPTKRQRARIDADAAAHPP